MIESLYLSLLFLSAALLCYNGFQNYSLIRSISCSCSTYCFGLGFQHQNLQDFIKIIRALIKDIFLRACDELRLVTNAMPVMRPLTLLNLLCFKKKKKTTGHLNFTTHDRLAWHQAVHMQEVE